MYKIPFTRHPFFLADGKSSTKGRGRLLLLKGAVEKINLEDPRLYSRLFMVPLKNWEIKTYNRSVQTVFSSLMQSLLPRDTLLRTYLTSLQLVTGTVWRR